MNKLINISKILICTLLLASCTNFLELDPRDSYTEKDVWNSLENTYLYVYGFYKPIYEYGPYGTKYGGVSMHDGFSDILRYNINVMGENGGNVNQTVYNGNISPNGNILSDYSYEYNRIRRINEFLYDLGRVNYPEKDMVQLEAQARFFRAYLYFMLVRNHKSVIIRDEVNGPDGPEEKLKGRSSEDECWDFIVKDLDFAADNLPLKWPANRTGLITRGAAMAFKSRAMLYAKRWEAAEEAAMEVIKHEGNLYELLDNYEDAFTVKDSKEAVLAFRFNGNVTHSIYFDKYYSPSGDFDKSNTDIKVLAVPTQEMVDMYKMADGSDFDWANAEHAANPYANREDRFYKSILYNGATWKNRDIETYVGGKDGFVEFGSVLHPNTTTTGYFIRKLLNEKVQDMGEKGITNWAEIRYAEVLLNHAEACVEQGKVAGALKSLNKVRSRAKLPELETTSAENLKHIVRHERTVELAFEGHRYWDLRRWRLSYTLLNGTKMHGMKITKDASGTLNYEVVECDKKPRVFEERYYQFPIPNSEIVNNELCTQFDKW